MTRTRKPKYRGSRAYDRTCRNHGTCPVCRGNRTYQLTKELLRVKQELAELQRFATKEEALEYEVEHVCPLSQKALKELEG